MRQLIALRRLAPSVFGVLMSLEPAVAAAAGLIVLGQRLGMLQLAGMACVVAVSPGFGSPGNWLLWLAAYV